MAGGEAGGGPAESLKARAWGQTAGRFQEGRAALEPAYFGADSLAVLPALTECCFPRGLPVAPNRG